VLFSGHFADEQIAMVESVADDWNLGGGPLTAIGLGINMVEGAAIAPDHAGVFETTMLSALWPERVDLGQLPQTDSDPSDDDEGTRHDPSHELWGVFGPDPRRFDPSAGAALLDVAANWLARRAGTDR
jgi:creatinine amidohydrolase